MDIIKNAEKEYDVMRSAFGIARALKRRPPHAPHTLPPGMERTLMTVAKSDGLSSGELCELLDVRPSSLSEITDKMVQRGLLEKKDSDRDKRITVICLTELGKAQAEQIEASRSEAIAALSSCFTEDEARQFCELADKLSEHLKSSLKEKTAPDTAIRDTAMADAAITKAMAGPEASADPACTAVQGILHPCPSDTAITDTCSGKT